MNMYMRLTQTDDDMDSGKIFVGFYVISMCLETKKKNEWEKYIWIYMNRNLLAILKIAFAISG